MNRIDITNYRITTHQDISLSLALVSDLHDSPYKQVLSHLKRAQPDIVVINGDLLYAVKKGFCIYDDVPISGQHLKYTQNALSFLKELVTFSSVVMSIGNHEIYLNGMDKTLLKKLGVILLDDDFCFEKGCWFGGLSSPLRHYAGKGYSEYRKKEYSITQESIKAMNVNWLNGFEKQQGYKILLCHHPELYDSYLSDKNIDLILSGHAHGGQIRLFGRGLYAHGQGWFPQYTEGFIEGRMIISRGLSNTTRVPRLWNPMELVFVYIN